ncbi:ARM repeat-containing protein [Obba rivulosa]|uniref:ARM repeat-containing protein n=1 Tax=Obba rivulosa TaxID=1052685 RepID=A0A8E2B5E2_9APHY|nr:ARM repeat-containing protein [Obba rivulosa]
MASSEIAQCLSATLSPDNNTRITAELKLNELFKSPQSSVGLAQLLLAQDADLALRQISLSINLRKYVTEHWSPYFTQFKGNAPPPELKTQVRQAVFQGLSDPNRKIRSLCAHTLSSIANSDWPDEYPDLLNQLMGLLASGSPDSVYGAMQVFTEFIKTDLTEDQILPILRQLLPVLLNIVGAAQQYAALSRARAIAVFRQCVETLYMVKEQHPQATKEASGQVLPVWLDAFKVLLNIDPRQDIENTQSWDGVAIRIQIYKTLDVIQSSFPKNLAPYLHDFLTASLNHLNALYPAFVHYYLLSEDSAPGSSEDEPIDLAQLACPIFDFVSRASRNGRGKEWFQQDNLNALVSNIFSWSQMTSSDEDEWARDANAFVVQETDEALSYSVRMAGFDLLACLLDRHRDSVVATSNSVTMQVIANSEQARSAGKGDWWKGLEAALAALGSQSETIVECIQDAREEGQPSPIDIESLLANVVPPLLGISDAPFLQGRAFVFASRYASLLPTEVAGLYVNAAVEALENKSAPMCVGISAVMALHHFCSGVSHSVLLPFMSRIANDLGPFLLQTTEDLLGLVLETLISIVSIESGKWLNIELAGALTVSLLEVWMKNNKDPIIISNLTVILEHLAGAEAPGIYENVIKLALPPLSNAILSSTEYDAWISGTAIEVVNGIVQGAPNTGLGAGFFDVIGPSLFEALRKVEDRDVIQSGIECLTSIIRKDVNQILNWKDPTTRQSGLECTLAVIARQLQSDNEAGGLVIGDLIIHLLRKAGDAVVPVLPELLQAMVARMQTARTATFIQSLVIPFAFLIHNGQRDTVLSLLESTNVDGRSGLEVLINTWCENAETFQGFWAIRISTLALSALYASERPNLQNLMVKGDMIVRPETKNVIMTRSKTKKMPTEWTSVPFPVKALKLMLHDLQSGGEAASMGLGSSGDADSDDGDEDWSDDGDEAGSKKAEYAYLSEIMNSAGINPNIAYAGSFDHDDALEAGDDEDLKQDPVSHIDLRGHILSFLRECAARNINNFSAVVGQLSPEEALVVRQVVSQQ